MFRSRPHVSIILSVTLVATLSLIYLVDFVGTYWIVDWNEPRTKANPISTGTTLPNAWREQEAAKKTTRAEDNSQLDRDITLPSVRDESSAIEQLFVYDLNLLRNGPEKNRTRFGIDVDLSDVKQMPPLAIDPKLVASAKYKAIEFAANDYFSHQSKVSGKWPNALARDQGFQLPAYFPTDGNMIESIAAGPSSSKESLKILIVDEGVPSLGHRMHLLGIDDFNGKAKSIGVGYAFSRSSHYQNYWAIHATWSEPDTQLFATGVVYDDVNRNKRYDLDEGIANATIEIDGKRKIIANAAGGWSAPLKPGKHWLSIPSDDEKETTVLAATIEIQDANVEVDFIVNQGVQVGFATTLVNDSYSQKLQ